MDLLNFLKNRQPAAAAPSAAPQALPSPANKLALTLPGAIQASGPAPQQQAAPASLPLYSLPAMPAQAPAAPSQPLPMQSAPQMPAMDYSNPYTVLMGGRNSVLSDDQRQAKLGQAFDSMVQSVVDGANPRARKEMAASQIFSGAAAALGGIMGGGYAKGGLDVLQQAQQHVQDARAERHQQQQDAMQGLKSLTDIVSNTSPYSQKALAAQLKGALAANNQKIQGFKAQALAVHQGNVDARGAQRNSIMADHYNNMEALKQAGLDLTGTLAHEKLDAAAKIEKDRADLRTKIAEMQVNAQKYGADKNYSAKMQELQQKDKLLRQQQQFAAEKFDSEMRAKLGRRDSMGNLVYQGVTIPSLAAQFAADEPEEEEQPDQSQQPQGAPAQQPPQPAPQAGVNPQMKAGFQNIVKQTGMHPDQARLMFIQSAMQKGGMTFEQAAEAAKGL